MCSISGVIQRGIEGRKATAVERMNAALRHRGPDDSGSVELKSESGETIGYLGNTRLAIIDTSPAGHMPMHDPDTGNWITYNGETYNFRQLRTEIGDEFGPWRSNTDTEVVLRAYRKWGIEAFGKLRGMFALAIWDNAKQKLVIARDRFGIKPLYYYVGSNDESPSLVFASEIRALLASEQVPRKLSNSAVKSYLQFGSVQAPLTIIENVRSLVPGQCLTVSATASSSFNVELLPFAIPADNSLPKSRPEAKAQLRTILEDSVRHHLVSDVPIGVFLSGGMDSSAIVALMSRVSPERPNTFSVVFSEQQFSEASHSRVVAEKFKTDHCEVELSETALLASLPQAIAALDQPSMDGINTYVVSKAVKEAGVTVALSGLGGDELFGGYPSFRRALTVQATNRMTKRLLKAVAPIGQRAQNGSAPRDKFWQLAAGDGSAASVYSISRQLFSDATVKSLSAAGDNGLGVRLHSNGYSDTFNAISKLELEGYMANTLLRDTDAMSMAHSLEVRVPFVDPVVAEFVLGLPGAWKVNGDTGAVPKPLLADVLTDLLPGEFLKRKKMGFTLPFEKWMCRHLREEISCAFADDDRLTSAGVKPKVTAEIWQRFLRSPKAVGWSRPWSLYVLAKWCEINQVSL